MTAGESHQPGRLEAEQRAVPAPVAAGIRTTVARAGIGFLVAGALLAGGTALLVLTAPDGNGFLSAITVAGGTTGGLLVVLAGIGLLDARQVVSDGSFLIGRARRVQRLLLLLFILTVVIGGMSAYGMLSIGEGPIAASLLVPLAGCLLSALAVVVSRSVLRPPIDCD
ncbi:MAG TPA: hypothetical protein VHH34_01460 [Pseudonocardiaceae bacterium]|nr:hypothetical protein [Pseudonocardiaceae bacterium]